MRHDMTVSWDRHLKNGNVWGVEVELSMQDTPGDFYTYTVKVYVVAPTSELAMYIVSTMYPDYESISVDDETNSNCPLIFTMNHQKDTTTKLNRFGVMFVGFALSMMVLSPILMYHLSPSGDSMILKKEGIQRLLTTPSKEIQ